MIVIQEGLVLHAKARARASMLCESSQSPTENNMGSRSDSRGARAIEDTIDNAAFACSPVYTRSNEKKKIVGFPSSFNTTALSTHAYRALRYTAAYREYSAVFRNETSTTQTFKLSCNCGIVIDKKNS